MAKAKVKEEEVAVAVVEEETKAVTLGSMGSMEELAGLGMEEVTQEDLAIPFLRILEPLSPQLDPTEGSFVHGAQQGMIINTVTNQLFTAKEGMVVVPCYYMRRYLEWAPRNTGGGFKGSHEPSSDVVGTMKKFETAERTEYRIPNGNLLSNTAQFFVLLITENGPQKCLITMSSTQLKRAKKWLTQMNSITAIGSNGKKFIVPMMASSYSITTSPETNAKGKWNSWVVEKHSDLVEGVDDELFEEAVKFAKAIRLGNVNVKHEDLHEPSGVGGADGDDDMPDDDIPF